MWNRESGGTIKQGGKVSWNSETMWNSVMVVKRCETVWCNSVVQCGRMW